MSVAYGYMHDMDGGWWVLMVLGWIAVSAIVIWAVVSLRADRRGHRDGGAIDVLDHRLATGEISVEEYRRLRDALRS